MKVTLYAALSINGMIARKHGEEDFLSDENWKKFIQLAKEHGNLIFGSKTYEALKSWGPEYSLSGLTDVEKVVISRTADYALDAGYTLAHSPQDALEKLSEKGFDAALLAGGATINAEFAQQGLIDEAILNVEPVFIGEGMPLFSGNDFQLNAELIATEEKDGLLTLRYKIKK
ncbi:MAG: dihydrofolate reductase family protein [Patescibacteria group bacterium]